MTYFIKGLWATYRNKPFDMQWPIGPLVLHTETLQVSQPHILASHISIKAFGLGTFLDSRSRIESSQQEG